MSAPRLSYRLLEQGAPKVEDQYTPWADAVVAVGRSKFGDQWNDAELALSDYLNIDREAIITARLKAEHPDLWQKNEKVANWSRVMGTSHRVGEPKTQAERDEAISLFRSQVARARKVISESLPTLMASVALNSTRKAQLIEAQKALCHDMMNSRVASFWYKRGANSSPVPLPVGEIIAANDTQHFNFFCKGMIRRNDVSWFVYVDSDMLAKLYPAIAAAEDDAAVLDLPHLSPYVRLMIHVSRLEQVTTDNQPKVHTLEALFRQHAPAFGLTFSPKSLYPEHMARFVREPHRQKGAPDK